MISGSWIIWLIVTAHENFILSDALKVYKHVYGLQYFTKTFTVKNDFWYAHKSFNEPIPIFLKFLWIANPLKFIFFKWPLF